LITLYISLGGELFNIYEYLIKKSVILETLSDNLLIADVVVIRNDPNKLQNKLVKANCLQTKELEEALNITKDYKNNLIKIKEYYESVFNKSFIDKVLLANKKRLSDSGILNGISVFKIRQ
jgi:hypothetical protein